MKNNKVLIIDDEEDFGMLMIKLLSSREYKVFVAHTIKEGLKILEEERPGFLLLDNKLPDGYGWGQTEYILSRYPDIHLNLISGVDVPKTSSSAFRILEKPIHAEELDKLFE